MALLTAEDRPHVVIADRDGAVRVAAALDAAGVGCMTRAPSLVRGIEQVGPCGLRGWKVHSAAGSDRLFAGVILACSLNRLPWLDPGLLDWEDGHPALVAGLLAPGLANLYIVSPDGGRAGGDRLALLAPMIQTQAELTFPLVDDLMRFVRPSHRPPDGRAARRMERRLERRLQPGERQSWWSAAAELPGPLDGARSS